MDLYTQAANSPDVSLLDLGFFQAIQSFNSAAPKNEEELIQSVQDTYTNYPRKRLNRTWLTLHSVFNQIILCNGDNDYNILQKIETYEVIISHIPNTDARLFEYEPK